MKVKELKSDVNLTRVKVTLPAAILHEFKDYAGGEKKMWVVGSAMGSFMMSPDSPDTDERRLYPMPMSVSPDSILEWKVSEFLK